MRNRTLRPAGLVPGSLARMLAVLGLLFVSLPALAQTPPFAGGWSLRSDSSTLAFQSVKNETIVEGSTFAIFGGSIDEAGQVRLEVQLDSVDTKIDLRNVRMRFLFFETFNFPTAVISAQLDPAIFADLPQLRRKVIDMPFTLDLHGISKAMVAQVAVVLISDDLVAVSAVAPVSVPVEDFGLLAGLRKLEEAANVRIIPSGTVTFDLLFARQPGAAAPATPAAGVAAAPVPPPPETERTGAAAALETQGAFSAEECLGRFEILSRSQSIEFPTAQARLVDRSHSFLDALADIIQRCPGMVIEVGGHTDSDGSASANQRLSERRAGSVAEYLIGAGIPATRLVVRGYGEDRPVAGNDTAAGKARNRRIEFRVVS